MTGVGEIRLAFDVAEPGQVADLFRFLAAREIPYRALPVPVDGLEKGREIFAELRAARRAEVAATGPSEAVAEALERIIGDYADVVAAPAPEVEVEEEPMRFLCFFPGCGRGFASPNGLAVHAARAGHKAGITIEDAGDAADPDVEDAQDAQDAAGVEDVPAGPQSLAAGRWRCDCGETFWTRPRLLEHGQTCDRFDGSPAV